MRNYQHQFTSKRERLKLIPRIGEGRRKGRGKLLTPSLLQPVNFPGGKMQGRACKQHIFRSYNPSTFNAMRLDVNTYILMPVQKEKTRTVSDFTLFYWSFWHVASWQ